MRKTLVALAIIGGLGIAGPACSSTWWQQFKSDPTAQVQTFEQTIQVAINAAELAWPAILTAIPAANQAAANLQFTNALAAVNHAEQLLNDGVAAAVAAQQSNPNFLALMQDVTDGVAQVMAIIDEYSGKKPAGDAGVAAATLTVPAVAGEVADLHAAYNLLSRWGVKVKQ